MTTYGTTKRMISVRFTKQMKVIIVIILVLVASATAYGIYYRYIRSSHEYTLVFAGADPSEL